MTEEKWKYVSIPLQAVILLSTGWILFNVYTLWIPITDKWTSEKSKIVTAVVIALSLSISQVSINLLKKLILKK